MWIEADRPQMIDSAPKLPPIAQGEDTSARCILPAQEVQR